MRLCLLLHSEEKETTFIHGFYTRGSLACRIPLRADASVPKHLWKALAQNRDFGTNKMYKKNLKSSASFKMNLTARDLPQLPPCWFHSPTRELRASRSSFISWQGQFLTYFYLCVWRRHHQPLQCSVNRIRRGGGFLGAAIDVSQAMLTKPHCL